MASEAQTTELIDIAALVAAAKARGFKGSLYNDGCYAELSFAQAPGGVWHGGCQYSTADFVIDDDKPCVFPWKSEHPGLTRMDAHGTAKLLAHPAMAGWSPSA